MAVLTQVEKPKQQIDVRIIRVDNLPFLKALVWQEIQNILAHKTRSLDLTRTIFQKVQYNVQVAQKLMYQLKEQDPLLGFWLNLIIYLTNGADLDNAIILMID